MNEETQKTLAELQAEQRENLAKLKAALPRKVRRAIDRKENKTDWKRPLKGVRSVY